MTQENELTTVATTPPAGAGDPLIVFADFLRLNVAQGDASPETIRSYKTHANDYVAWCWEQGVDPVLATEVDLQRYRAHLVGAGYTRGTIAVKLSVVRRLYQAAVWRGLRQDNPAAGLKPPKDKTSRAERVKYLPLEGLKRLLQAPSGDDPQARRDRAILVLMGIHGLRVAEVVKLKMDDVDLSQGTVRVVGKGRKTRTIYLTTATAGAQHAWLEVRPLVARPETRELFVALDRRAPGTSMSDRAIRYLVDGYLERLGLKARGISCHALRHSAATWARAGGAALDAIAGMLGHSSVTTTQIYAHIVNQMTENPAKYLEAMIGTGGVITSG